MQQGTQVIHNVRVFDGLGLTEVQDIGISDGLIVDAGRDGGAEEMDGAGRTLLPGLIDTHLHVAGRDSLTACARWGLSTVLDLGTRVPAELVALRNSTGLPQVLTAGIPATAAGGQHTRKMGFPTSSVVVDAADARRFVNERLAEGADFIKIIVEDPKVPGTKALPPASVAALVDAAHEAGMKVIAHAVTVASMTVASDAGVDVLTHTALDGQLTKPAVQRMQAAGLVLIPTMTMMRGSQKSITSTLLFRALSAVRVAPTLRYENVIATVDALHSEGVVVLAGTDANAEFGSVPANPVFGEALHDEMAALVEAGLSAAQALAAATTVAARTFGLSDRGVVAPGHRADLVLVDGDPTHDISHTRHIVASWIGGVRTQ